MESVIRYKFKDSKAWNTVSFRGRFISVEDLRLALAKQHKCTPETTLGWTFREAQTGQDYRRAGELIAQNAAIVVKQPLGGTIVQAADLANKVDKEITTCPNRDSKTKDHETANPEDEDVQKMMKLIQDTSTASPAIKPMPSIHSGIGMKRGERKTPSKRDLACHGCDQTGHFVRECPNKPSRHRVSSVYVAPQKPASRATAGLSLGLFATQQIEQEDHSMVCPMRLKCTICNDSFRDATVVDCCFTSYCRECITEKKECPTCGGKTANIQQHPNTVLQKAVNEHLSSAGKSRPSPTTPAAEGLVVKSNTVSRRDGTLCTGASNGSKRTLSDIGLPVAAPTEQAHKRQRVV